MAPAVAEAKTVKCLADVRIKDLPVQVSKSVKSLADMGIKDLPANYVKDEDERPAVAYNDFSKAVPVISLANAEAGGEERAQLLRELQAAYEEWGMFCKLPHLHSKFHSSSKTTTGSFGYQPHSNWRDRFLVGSFWSGPLLHLGFST